MYFSKLFEHCVSPNASTYRATTGLGKSNVANIFVQKLFQFVGGNLGSGLEFPGSSSASIVSFFYIFDNG